MKLTIVSNIKGNFTYKIVRRSLSLFWVNRIIRSNHKKIWLTIKVTTTDNNTFFVIKNLPFNTKDFRDISIVLLAYFRENKNLLKRYRVKDISIIYRLMLKESLRVLTSHAKTVAPVPIIESKSKQEVNKSKYWILWYKLVKNSIIFLLSALFIFITTVLLIISLDLIIDDPGLLTRDDLPFISFDLFATCSCAEQIRSSSHGINVQPCIFSPFIDFFDKDSSVYKYFPSYLVNSQFTLPILVPNSGETTTGDLAVDERVLAAISKYNQYFMLEYRNKKYYCLVHDLYNIVSDYIQQNKKT